MSTTYKEFGKRPIATVRVTTQDLIDQRAKVRVNWSTCGELPISDAITFYNKLGEAIGYARHAATKLGLEIKE